MIFSNKFRYFILASLITISSVVGRNYVYFGHTFANYIYFALAVLALPYLLGVFFTEIFFSKNSNYFKIPKSIQFWGNWIVGVVTLNIPYLINSFLKTDPFNLVLIFLWFCFCLYIFFTKDYKINFSSLTKIERSRYYNIAATIFGFVLVVLYYSYWVHKIGFSTTTADIFQNYHLGNIYNKTKVFTLFPDQLTTMFNLVTYTTLLIPIYAFSSFVVSPLYILESFGVLEITITGIIYFSRKKLLEDCFEVTKNLSWGISALSLFISGYTIYPIGNFINQQVVVWLSTVILYLYLKKYYKWFTGFILVSFAFHSITTIILLFWVFIHFVVELFYDKKFNSQKSLINFFKACLILLGSFSVYISSRNDFKIMILNLARQGFVNLEAVGYLESHNQFFWVEVLQDSFGFVVLAIVFIASTLGLFIFSKKQIWVVVFSWINLVLLFSFIPHSQRFLSLFALPVVLLVYYTLDYCFKNQAVKNILLIFILITNLIMVNIREQKVESANIFNKPYIQTTDWKEVSKYYMDSEYKNLYQNENNKIKVISDYPTKHIAEISMNKFNDVGVYEFDNDEREANFKILNNQKTDSCRHYSKFEYLLFVYSPRTFASTRAPLAIFRKANFNIWDVNVVDKITQDYIVNYKPQVENSVVMETKTNNSYKFILIKCS